VIEPRESIVLDLWGKILEIPHFGQERAKEHTVAAQPVMLKALAKIAYDLNFSNRRPEDAESLWVKFLGAISAIDFSHGNPMWRYYTMTDDERVNEGL